MSEQAIIQELQSLNDLDADLQKELNNDLSEYVPPYKNQEPQKQNKFTQPTFILSVIVFSLSLFGGGICWSNYFLQSSSTKGSSKLDFELIDSFDLGKGQSILILKGVKKIFMLSKTANQVNLIKELAENELDGCFKMPEKSLDEMFRTPSSNKLLKQFYLENDLIKPKPKPQFSHSSTSSNHQPPKVGNASTFKSTNQYTWNQSSEKLPGSMPKAPNLIFKS
ncbi:MAG TPA: hypothetical protein V6C96_04900 [Vampirovibrionales bacterium]